MNIINFSQLKNLLDNSQPKLCNSGRRIGKRGICINSKKLISLNTICKIFKRLEKTDNNASFKDKQYVAHSIKILDKEACLELKNASLSVKIAHFFRKLTNLFFDRDKILRPHLIKEDIKDKSILLEVNGSRDYLLKMEAAISLYDKKDNLWQKAEKAAYDDYSNDITKIFIELIEDELKSKNFKLLEILQNRDALCILSISPEFSKAIKLFVTEHVQNAITEKVKSIIADIYLALKNENYYENCVGKINWCDERNQKYIHHIINAFHDNGFSIRGIYTNSVLRNLIKKSHKVIYEVFFGYVMSHDISFKEKDIITQFSLKNLNRNVLVKEILKLFDCIKKFNL